MLRKDQEATLSGRLFCRCQERAGRKSAMLSRRGRIAAAHGQTSCRYSAKARETPKNIRTNLRTSAKTIDMLLRIIYNRQVESRYGSRRSGNVSERFATKFILLFDDHERDICFHAHYFFRRTRLSLNNRKSKSITRSAIVRYVLSARTANSSV